MYRHRWPPTRLWPRHFLPVDCQAIRRSVADSTTWLILRYALPAWLIPIVKVSPNFNRSGPTGSPRNSPEPSSRVWFRGSASKQNRVCGRAWMSRTTRTWRASMSRMRPDLVMSYRRLRDDRCDTAARLFTHRLSSSPEPGSPRPVISRPKLRLKSTRRRAGRSDLENPGSLVPERCWSATAGFPPRLWQSARSPRCR